MKKTVFLLLFAFLLIACNKDQPEPELRPADFPISKTDSKIILAQNTFGHDMLKQLQADTDNSENIMLSAFSISTALSMTYNGAAGETAEEIKTVLNLEDLSAEEINNSCRYLMQQLYSLDPKVSVSAANSVWYNKDYSIKTAFIDILSLYYSAKVEGLDFLDPQSVEIINEWVSQQTKGKIDEIITEIDPATLLFLINAVYFNGEWHYAFDADLTAPKEFHTGGETIQVPTMNMQADLNYFANDSLQMIELPYGRGNYAMYILLPASDYSVSGLINGLEELQLRSFIEQMQANGIDLFMPKFSFEYEKTLNDFLIEMGMPVAFTGAADFSNISDYAAYISYVKHKTFIETDEKGTEAAAVTVVAIELSSAGNGTAFPLYINRPFIFLIRETVSGLNLFQGVVYNPL